MAWELTSTRCNGGFRRRPERSAGIELQRRQRKFLELEDLKRLAADLAVAPDLRDDVDDARLQYSICFEDSHGIDVGVIPGSRDVVAGP